MAHEVIPASHPNLAHLRMFGPLTLADMACDDELGLNAGRPIFVLTDILDLTTPLPAGFMHGARTSFFVNPNTQHLALVVRSGLLRSVALMVAKLTNQRDKISLHDTVTDAEHRLIVLIRQRGL